MCYYKHFRFVFSISKGIKRKDRFKKKGAQLYTLKYTK